MEPVILSSPHCFELYGFDILLDGNYRPWLLEVNVSPSLSSGSKLDKWVKTNLMCELMTLVGVRRKGEGGREVELTELRLTELLSHEDLSTYPLSPSDSHLLSSISSEFRRKGHFDLLFPLRNNIDYYSQFFTKQKYANLLLWKWLKSGCVE